MSILLSSILWFYSASCHASCCQCLHFKVFLLYTYTLSVNLPELLDREEDKCSLNDLETGRGRYLTVLNRAVPNYTRITWHFNLSTLFITTIQSNIPPMTWYKEGLVMAEQAADDQHGLTFLITASGYGCSPVRKLHSGQQLSLRYDGFYLKKN